MDFMTKHSVPNLKRLSPLAPMSHREDDMVYVYTAAFLTNYCSVTKSAYCCISCARFYQAWPARGSQRERKVGVPHDELVKRKLGVVN